MKKIVIIGCTGSVGTQTLNVIKRHSDKFEVLGAVAHSNYEKLIEIKNKFTVKHCGLFFPNDKVDNSIVYGEDCIEIAGLKEADIVVIASSGISALNYVVKAIENGKTIAIANKETLVSGGEFIMPLVKKHNATLIPIDSEHNAIWQCLMAGEKKDVSKLILTASGGAFRDKSIEELKNVTKADALKHPNWSMGAKITVDCASMMNKGLEIIEAKWLFDMPIDKIDVVLHRESIIHSMVEFVDRSCMAELSYPTMEIPIGLALSFPHRLVQNVPSLDFFSIKNLSFQDIDNEKYPFLNLCKEVGRIGGLLPTVMNTANEVMVEKFLNGEIAYLDIFAYVRKIVEESHIEGIVTQENILEVDKMIRAKSKAKQ